MDLLEGFPIFLISELCRGDVLGEKWGIQEILSVNSQCDVQEFLSESWISLNKLSTASVLLQLETCLCITNTVKMLL